MATLPTGSRPGPRADTLLASPRAMPTFTSKGLCSMFWPAKSTVTWGLGSEVRAWVGAAGRSSGRRQSRAQRMENRGWGVVPCVGRPPWVRKRQQRCGPCRYSGPPGPREGRIRIVSGLVVAVSALWAVVATPSGPVSYAPCPMSRVPCLMSCALCSLPPPCGPQGPRYRPAPRPGRRRPCAQ